MNAAQMSFNHNERGMLPVLWGAAGMTMEGCWSRSICITWSQYAPVAFTTTFARTANGCGRENGGGEARGTV